MASGFLRERQRVLHRAHEKEEKQGRIFILAWLAAMVLGFVGTGVLMSKFDFRYWAAVGISTVFLTILGLAPAFFASLIANR